jgi:hypothetical protein
MMALGMNRLTNDVHVDATGQTNFSYQNQSESQHYIFS